MKYVYVVFRDMFWAHGDDKVISIHETKKSANEKIKGYKHPTDYRIGRYQLKD